MYFNFRRLIEKYTSEFKAIILTDGDYNKQGVWEEGKEVEKTLYGAVISHKESRIFRSDGNLTAKDKRLFVFAPIEGALHNAKIVYEGDVYSLLDNAENAKFTGVYAYTLKYISAFKEGGE